MITTRRKYSNIPSILECDNWIVPAFNEEKPTLKVSGDNWPMSDIEYQDVISQYQNPELVSEGGQKIVFKVHHPKFGLVALKIGNYTTPSNPIGWDIARIEREAGIMKRIDPPYYPKFFQFEKISNYRYIIIEEFIESTPLSRRLGDYRNPSDALNLIRHLTLGLNVIWTKNIVHRDLKPANILIPPNGVPKIIDLGIARIIDLTSITHSLARGPCTPQYAAPELLCYKKNEIGKRTDQFSMGIILVQLLLGGQHPFDFALVGGTAIHRNILADNWYRQVFDEAKFSPIRPIASKLLGNKPYQRYRKVEMLIRDIDSCLSRI